MYKNKNESDFSNENIIIWLYNSDIHNNKIIKINEKVVI